MNSSPHQNPARGLKPFHHPDILGSRVISTEEISDSNSSGPGSSGGNPDRSFHTALEGSLKQPGAIKVPLGIETDEEDRNFSPRESSVDSNIGDEIDMYEDSVMNGQTQSNTLERSAPYQILEASEENEARVYDDEDEEPLMLRRRANRFIEICGDRPYREWIGLDDRGHKVRVPGCGTLFPAGYQPNWNSRYPWTCPIRDCRNLFEHARNMGTHFVMKHKGDLLNDNGDQTFSVVGNRKPQGSLERGKAAVISLEPLAASAPPLAKPSVPPKHGKGREAQIIDEHYPPTSQTKRRPEEQSVVGSSKPKKARRMSYRLNTPSFGPARRPPLHSSHADILSRSDTATDSSTGKMKRSWATKPANDAFGSTATESIRVENSYMLSRISSGSQASSGLSSQLSKTQRQEATAYSWGGNGELRAMTNEGLRCFALSRESLEESEQTIDVIAGASFRNLTLIENTGELIPVADQTRVCFVAAGRLLVKIGNNVFEVGFGGIWNILPGEECHVENHNTYMCLIYITTLSGRMR